MKFPHESIDCCELVCVFFLEQLEESSLFPVAVAAAVASRSNLISQEIARTTQKKRDERYY
jgi:hypothetical protein